MSNYLPLRLAQNPVVVTVDAADPLIYPERAGLRYYLTLMVPDFYGANTFSPLIEFEQSEIPPQQVAGGTIYRGAWFELQDQLDSLLTRKAPTFGQTGIGVCDGLVTPYYLKARITDNDDDIWTRNYPVDYAIKAGVAERDFAAYKGDFFTEFMAQQFLTWNADAKLVQPDQPEFLYWVANVTPLAGQLRLQCELTFVDVAKAAEIATVASLDNATPMTVYCLAVGPAAVGAVGHADVVAAYSVWLEDQHGVALTQRRTYRLDPEYRRQTRYLLFANSLGGFDTLCLTGQSDETVKLSRNVSDRYSDYAYAPSYSEQVINSVTGERQLTVNTGWLKPYGLTFLQELLLSKEVYLVTDRAFLPLVPATTDLRAVVDDEDLIGRQLAFTFANPEHNFSNLPRRANIPTRPTAWRPKATTCLLDQNGRRTGKMGVALIEKYYLDDGSRVGEVPIKANVPGTEGYMAPAQSALCAVSPFLSAQVQRTGTFSNQTCPAGQFGGVALVTIPAGEYGSEVSQADADAKAEAAWSRANTQEYANANAPCVAGPQFYTAVVPAGCWHYRSNSPQNFYIYYKGNPPAGNVFTLPPGPNVYPVNSNDLDLPLGDLPALWVLDVKAEAGGVGNVKVYVNGLLKQTLRLPYNADNPRPITVDQVLASGDKVYIEFEHIRFA